MQPPQSSADTGPHTNLPCNLGPEHVPDLYRTLLSALDTANSTAREKAEGALRRFETVPCFLDALAVIIQAPEADIRREARLLAVLCINNVVRRHWRNNNTRNGSQNPRVGGTRLETHVQERFGGSGGRETNNSTSHSPHAVYLREQQLEARTVSDEEKKRLRTFLIYHMCERDDVVAKNLAHVLAKVVRADWPGQWPDFFQQLLSLHPFHGSGAISKNNNFHQQDDLQTLRVIQTLYRVIKELAGKSLLADKAAFQSMARSLFPVVHRELWLPRLHRLVAFLEQGDYGEHVLRRARVVKTLSKTLCYLSVQHAGVLERDSLESFFFHAYSAFGPLLTAEKGLLAPFATASSPAATLPAPLSDLLIALAKITKNLSYMVSETQQRSPSCLSSATLSLFLHLFFEHVCSTASCPSEPVLTALVWDPGLGSCSRKFYLNACAFLGNCLSCPDYQSGEHHVMLSLPPTKDLMDLFRTFPFLFSIQLVVPRTKEACGWPRISSPRSVSCS